MAVYALIALLCLALAAAGAAWARASLLGQRVRELDAAAADGGARLAEAERELAAARSSLEHERAANAEKVALVEEAKRELVALFNSASGDALRNNSTAFLELARAQLEQLQLRAKEDLGRREQAVEQMLLPIRETLHRFDGQLRGLETARTEAYGAVTTQLRALAETQRELRQETSSLVGALRAPAVRGRWGEMQLRRVVEAAGMLPYCDFAEQATAMRDGRLYRPDLIVHLAGGKNVVVDAKAPLQAYLDALEAKDEATRKARLVDHARQLRDHVVKLSGKGYWAQFDGAPEFAVLFIPGETFLSAALEHDPALIERAAERQVIVATPTTLIAVLWAVAHGWREERIAENARRISELGRDLYNRLGTLGGHFTRLGRSLDATVRAYNDAAGSLESRVLVGARRFKELGATSTGEIKPAAPVQRTVRPLAAPELVGEGEQTQLPEADAA
jgi:DNA recombination protein RmuC